MFVFITRITDTGTGVRSTGVMRPGREADI
jgi:hypothetical protein